MSTEEILQEFTGHLDRYEKHRSYIAKARQKADKFSPEVVEKVILDHEIKSSTIADDIIPLVPRLESAMTELEDKHAGVSTSKDEADKRLEELQLRLEIEELDQEEFGEASAATQNEIQEAEETLELLDQQIGALIEVLDKWSSLADAAGQETGRTAPPSSEEPGESFMESADMVSDKAQVVVEDIDGSHVSRSVQVEDLSSVLEHPSQGPDEEPVMAIEADEAEIGPGEASIDMGFGDSQPQDAAEIDLQLSADSEVEVEAEGEVDISPAEDEVAIGTRRALLLYQEGTAEEQIYPFTGELITIGRGRDNDVQIKNDSKVSRYHCRVFRNGDDFFIEDNKSSNGTLVNGELIDERRLFGGEEIIIGETFFRFRIME